MEMATLSGGHFHISALLAENPTLSSQDKKLAWSRSIKAPILFKKHVECGMRALLSERLRTIAPFLTYKTPCHKVCDLGFPFQIPFQKHVNATFEAHCEQKRERSYNPKRFSSSSLMIFNAFTRA